MYLKAYKQNLVKNGPEVSEKSMFYFAYINDLVPSSRNDLDLQYSHTFINTNTCLHIPTFRPQSAIVFEKSTVFTFSHRKAYVTKFDLVVKKGQGNSRIIICINYDGQESLMLHTKLHGNPPTGSGEDF